MDYTRITLGQLLSSDNMIIRNNATSILKQLQRDPEALNGLETTDGEDEENNL